MADDDRRAFYVTNDPARSDFKRKGTRGAGRRRPYQRYPFAEMQPGQSFVVLAADVGRVRSAAFKWSKRHGGRFSVVTNAGVCRCGRIE